MGLITLNERANREEVARKTRKRAFKTRSKEQGDPTKQWIEDKGQAERVCRRKARHEIDGTEEH